MKKFFIFVLIILICGGIYFYYTNYMNVSKNKTTEIYDKTDNKKAEENKNITKDEALKIIENVYGTKDEQTGNTMSYSYITTIKDKDSNEYYAFRESWLVDNSHMSFLQNIFVSMDGNTIHTTSTAEAYTLNQVVEFDE